MSSCFYQLKLILFMSFEFEAYYRIKRLTYVSLGQHLHVRPLMPRFLAAAVMYYFGE